MATETGVRCVGFNAVDDTATALLICVKNEPQRYYTYVDIAAPLPLLTLFSVGASVSKYKYRLYVYISSKGCLCFGTGVVEYSVAEFRK